MDNISLLSLAHQKGRSAEKFLKQKAFDQAIECHLNATTLLEEAMKLTSFAKSLESLQLQKNFHLTQTNIIKAHQERLTRIKQLSELRKKKKMEKRKVYENTRKEKDVKTEILRTMEYSDFLISQLHGNQDSKAEYDQEGSSEEANDIQTISEELRKANSQLRSHINKLFDKIENDQNEKESLRIRLKMYEREYNPNLGPLDFPNLDFSK